MGCGASNDPKIGVSDSINPVKTNNNNSRNNNGFKQVELKNSGQNSYSDPRNLPDTRNSNLNENLFTINNITKNFIKLFCIKFKHNI